MKGQKLEWGTNHERLWTPGNKQRVLEGREVGAGVSPAMDIREGTDCLEHWASYANSESWNVTSNTNDVLYGD